MLRVIGGSLFPAGSISLLCKQYTRMDEASNRYVDALTVLFSGPNRANGGRAEGMSAHATMFVLDKPGDATFCQQDTRGLYQLTYGQLVKRRQCGIPFILSRTLWGRRKALCQVLQLHGTLPTIQPAFGERVKLSLHRGVPGSQNLVLGSIAGPSPDPHPVVANWLSPGVRP